MSKSLEHEATLSWATPDEALMALNALVSRKYDWNIVSGGVKNNMESRWFVLKRRIPYPVIRGARTYTEFSAAGRLSTNERGETIVRYTIYGQPLLTAFYAGIWVLIIPVFVAMIFSVPTAYTNWIVWALAVFLFGLALGYIWVVIKRYQERMSEMRAMMVDFTRT